MRKVVQGAGRVRKMKSFSGYRSRRRLSLAEEAREFRCECRRLLARIARGVVMLKCPRCKREAVLFLGEENKEVEVFFS